jgi:peptidylprolyl isomerase
MDNISVILETSQGEVSLKLFPEVAPKACENFSTHAERGYYDGVIFHRVIKEFMIQGGDPDGTGMGGQSIWGKPFEDECSKEVTFNRPGLLAMANAGPKTNGSQFFITCAQTPWLNLRHTIFGEVTEGMDIIRAIEAVDTDRRDRPVDDVTILKARVVRS